MAEKELAYKRKARLRGKNRKIRIEQVYDMNNLRCADHEARKGKDGPTKNHKGVRVFDKDAENLLMKLQKALQEETYHTSEGHECERMCPCGKVRLLHKLPYYPDHIEHHALMQVIFPVMKRYYYFDSSASIKGKGMHFAQRRTEKYIRRNMSAGRLYYAKIDFVKFYHNIDQMKCFDCLARTFGNAGIRYLIWEVLTACKEGLGIGLYPIQPMANFYTCPLCRLVMMLFDVWVEIYCDDIVIMSRDKKQVWKAVNYIIGYAREDMRQEVHKGIGVQVIDERHMVDFVGYQFFFGHTFVRKKMKVKFKRKMHNLKDPMRRYQVATAYKGWLMHCDGFTLWRKIMGMKSFKDLQVPKFDDVDGDGKRMLKGARVSASILVGREIVFLDAEIGVKSKFLKNGQVKKSTLIQVEEHGQKFKFFTDNQKLIKTVEYVKEHDGFPFKGTIVNVNTGGGLPDYEIQ